MSGGNSKQKSRAHTSGWEEAGGEFYQESYPGGEQDLFEQMQKTDAAKLHTLLPSKQARTIKRVRSQNERRQSTFARTTHSRDTQLSMLPDLSENLSNEERTWEEIMEIKAMTVPMGQKRDLKIQLQNATKLRLQGLEQLQWRQRKIWHRFSIRFSEMIGKLELWRFSLKVIEGNFGIGVVSYFVFLRWLLFLNIFISIVITVFLVLPTVLSVETRPYCFDLKSNYTACCSQAYLDKNVNNNPFLDVIQGTGFMERTILFYGVYSDQIYTYFAETCPWKPLFYNMPLAYIIVCVFWALFSLICIIKAASNGFREKLVESEGQFYLYCNLVFGGWDFCINNDRSAHIKHKALFNEIKGCLEEQKYKEESQLRTKDRTCLLYLKRILINLVIFGILLLSAFAIYATFNFSMDKLSENTDTGINGTVTGRLTLRLYSSNTPVFDQLESVVLEFLPFICIVLLNMLVPEIFGYLVKFENYRPAKVLIFTLLRTVLLRLSSLAVLLIQIYLHVTAPNRNICSLNNTDPTAIECWETYMGQQLYKLIITDFVIQLLTTFLINFPRSFIARHTRSRFFKIVGQQNFYLPKHVLDIVYIQTIIWLGTFFCPFLPIFGSFYYFFVFYIKKFACLINSTPSISVNRASKSKNMFMSILLLSFIVAIIPVSFSIAELVPSINCGPYRGYITVWDFVIETFNRFPLIFKEAIFFLSTSTFAVPAFAILLFFLYYYWAVSSANRHMNVVLKNQLVLEGHDKQFLLNRLSAFIRQHQKRCERARSRVNYNEDGETLQQSSR